MLGIIYFINGEIEKAEEEILTARELFMNIDDVKRVKHCDNILKGIIYKKYIFDKTEHYRKLANLYYETNSIEKAEEALRKAIRVNPKSARAYNDPA